MQCLKCRFAIYFHANKCNCLFFPVYSSLCIYNSNLYNSLLCPGFYGITGFPKSVLGCIEKIMINLKVNDDRWKWLTGCAFVQSGGGLFNNAAWQRGCLLIILLIFWATAGLNLSYEVPTDKHLSASFSSCTFPPLLYQSLCLHI